MARPDQDRPAKKAGKVNQYPVNAETGDDSLRLPEQPRKHRFRNVKERVAWLEEKRRLDAGGEPAAPELAKEKRAGGMNKANGSPDEFTDNKRPTFPVRKEAGVAVPDGGGMGSLPLPAASTQDFHAVTPKAEQERRMNMCRECPELISMDRCRRCGCFMRIKTRMAIAHCPLGKW